MRRMTAGVLAGTIVAGLLAAGGARADALADRLAPHVGEAIDLVELGTGRRFVRPVLEGVQERGGKVAALRVRAEGETRVTTLPIGGIVKIVAGRETVHEAESKGTSASQVKARKARADYEKKMAASLDRMKAAGVTPWPALDADEQAAEVKALEAYVADVKSLFPRLEVSQTHEFIVATDIPPAQMTGYVAGLDAMHDALCDLYGIPRGEPVWKGKCLVIAFLSQDDFRAYEKRFHDVEAAGYHGLCHQSSDGRVITACHRGDDAPAFAHMLVHETSHGFNHRWLSPARIPNWLNEGIAEWVGSRVVTSDQVPLKEAQALQFMQAQGNLGPEFFDRHPIEPVQYGIASGLVKFLVKQDPKRFAAFVQGIKEGSPAEESLQKAFGGTTADLVKAYGTVIGLPNLKP
jgi:hypothetical protein